MNIRPDTVLYQVLSDIKAQAARVTGAPAPPAPAAPAKPAVASPAPDRAASPSQPALQAVETTASESERLRPRGSVINIVV